MGTRSWWYAFAALLAFNAAVYAFLSTAYVNPDGIGYFSYLPSIFFDHTLSFQGPYEHFQLAMPPALTTQGWLANIWAFGTSLSWLPFFLAMRALLAFEGAPLAPAWNGLYLEAINFGTMALGAASMVLLFNALAMLQLRRRPGLVVLAALLGTPLFFYSFLMGSVAHAATAFASGLYLWYWLGTTDQILPSRTRWFCLGLLGGLAATVRTQEGLILAVAFLDWLDRWQKSSIARPFLRQSLGWLLAGVIVGFSPQSLVWQILYGSPLHAPAIFNLSWRHFALGRCLFSSYHGLFTWTPVYALALAGFLWQGTRKDRKAILLGGLLAGQLLINGFSLAWWEGLSFGLRQMTGTAFLVGVGLAYWFDNIHDLNKSLAFHLATGLTALGAFWTLSLALQAHAGALDLMFYVPPRELLQIGLRGWHALGALMSLPGPPAAAKIAWFILLMEGVTLGWLALLVQSAGNRAKLPLTRILLCTFLPLILYANAAVLRAGRAPKPAIPTGQALNEAELADFFKFETYEVLALYHAKRGEVRHAAEFFALAEKTLPARPATLPWRAQLAKILKPR